MNCLQDQTDSHAWHAKVEFYSANTCTENKIIIIIIIIIMIVFIIVYMIVNENTNL